MSDQTVILLLLLCCCICCCLVSSSFGWYKQCDYTCYDPIKCCEKNYKDNNDLINLCKNDFTILQLMVRGYTKPYNTLSDSEKKKYINYDKYLSAINKMNNYINNKNVSCDKHKILFIYITYLGGITKLSDINQVKNFFISNSEQQNIDFLNTNKNSELFKKIYHAAYNLDPYVGNNIPSIDFTKKPVLPNIYDRSIFSDLIESKNYI